MENSSKIIVRYAETDKMGIVNHSVYPIWYEVARTNFIKVIGLTYSQMEEMGIMTPLVGLTCKYIQPAYYEDELVVKVNIGKLTPVKIEFQYAVYKTKENKLINTGTTVHAIVGKNLKPNNCKKMFPEIYSKLESLIG